MRRIDWPNHLVGFFSALFGILIAFELDEWRENRKDDKIAVNAFARIQQEIDINRNMLREMVNSNTQMIDALQTQVMTRVDERLLFTGTRDEALELNKFEGLSRIVRISTKGQRPSELHVIFSGLTHPVIHNSAWESAKTIGALNNMSYEKVLLLSSLYNPTRMLDELSEIRSLLRNADEITSKTGLEHLLDELEDAYRIIESELEQYDAFAAMLRQME